MAEIQAKIDELEAEMARTQKNKATNYHLGRYTQGKDSDSLSQGWRFIF